MTRIALFTGIGLIAAMVTSGCAQAGADQPQANGMAADMVTNVALATPIETAQPVEVDAAQSGSAQGCQAFLVGTWTAQGPHDLLGETRELDYRYAFGADGRYETNMRYRNPGAQWQDHEMRGTWTASPEGGPQSRQCALQLNVDQDGMTGSSTSTVTMVDDNSLDLGMGVVLRRQP